MQTSLEIGVDLICDLPNISRNLQVLSTPSSCPHCSRGVCILTIAIKLAVVRLVKCLHRAPERLREDEGDYQGLSWFLLSKLHSLQG